jgi:hypothetical protein
MRNKRSSFMVILFIVLIFSTQIMAQKFDFNNGTNQGWTMQGAYDESGNGPYSSNFTIGWTKLVNYPAPDPSSNKGSLLFYTSGGHGVTGSSGNYWIMQLISPDLSTDTSWQSATGFSVRITENMTVGSSLYANLIVTVYDNAQGKYRSFYNDQLLNQKLTYSSWFNANAVWNHLTFDWSNISTFPTNYQLKSIQIQIMGEMNGLYEGQVGVDEVIGQSAPTPTSSITVTAPNGGEKWEAGTQRNITWTGQGINNYDVKIEYSTNNGAAYTFVGYKTNYGTSGSYSWTVPNIPSTQCLIRLSVLIPPDISDVSNAVFEITQPSQPFTFTGHVYQGNMPDISKPAAGVTMELFGDVNEWPVDGPKTLLATTTTNSSGQFTLSSGSGNSNHNYYHIIETDPTNTFSVGAQAGHPGYVKNYNCVSYQNSTLTPGNTYSGSAFWDVQSSTGNTQPGTEVQVILSNDVSLIFDEVTIGGNTTLETAHTGPVPPDHFVINPPSSPLYYDIKTTASYSGMIHLKIKYDDTELNPDIELNLNIFKYIESNSEWLGITTSVEIENNLIYGTTDHLSVYAIMYQSEEPVGNGLIVTHCSDFEPGSFRDAIIQANSNPGLDTIRFNIPKNIPGYDPSTGVWFITPQSPLPSITEGGLIIDGFSQKEFIGEDANPEGPEICLNGELAGPYADGLSISSGFADIFGLTICSFQKTGIAMYGVDGGLIAGCYVGIDFGGKGPAANGYGIWLGNNARNVVIAPYDTFKNVISGNTYGGIFVSDTSSHVSILGNIIGLNSTGIYPIGNGDRGGISIQHQCDSVHVYDNWIGGNNYGIYIMSSRHITIGNNAIGLNRVDNEILELGNTNDGIYLDQGAQDNLITENFIRFNGANGVHIIGTNTIRNKVSHNHISRNAWKGISNESGGNLELAPPVITNVSDTSVTGTAIPNATLEIYTDPENQGMRFQGETNSDASGNFTWNGEITGAFTNVTALVIDDQGNTSEFSSPFIAAGILVSAPILSSSPGDTIDVPITVEDVTGQDIYGTSFTIETQTGVLTPIGTSITGTILEAWGTPTTQINGGQITVACAGSNPLSGSGTLIIIQYQVNASAQAGQSTPIHFIDFVFNEGLPAASLQDGLFSVSSDFNITGNVNYFNNDHPIVNTTLTIDGNQTNTITDGTGTFSFTKIPGGNYTLKPTKDGALGTSISAFDASMVLRNVVGLTSLTPYQKIAADVSGNGGVSALDASYILRYVVGSITQFPVSNDWTFVPANFSIDDTNWHTAPDSINYMPLNSDQIDQNFYGIIYGDISGNWAPAGQPLARVPKSFSGSANVQWGEVGNLSTEQFDIPILIDLNGELISAEFSIRFDPHILQFKAIEFSNTMNNFNTEYHLTPGELNVALAGVHSITSIDELARIKFEIIEQKDVFESSIELNEIKLNEGMITVNLLNHRVSFNPALPSTMALHQNYPNPFNPNTTIQFEIPFTGKHIVKVELRIYNLQGELICTLMNEEKEPGIYQIQWDGLDESSSKVATGIYLYQIRASEFNATKKMILMK